MSRKRVASLVGRDPETVRKWVVSGCPSNADGTLNAKEVIAWLLAREFERGKTAGAKAAPAAADGEINEKDPRYWGRRRLRAMALQAEFDLEVAKKKFTRMEEVESAVTKLLVIIRTALLAMPQTLAPKLVKKRATDIATEIERYLADVMRRVNETFREEMDRLGSHGNDRGD